VVNSNQILRHNFSAIERDAQQKIVHLTLHDPEGNEIGLVNE